MYSIKRFWVYFIFANLLYAAHIYYVYMGLTIPLFIIFLFLIMLVQSIVIILLYFLILYLRMSASEEQFKEIVIKLKGMKGLNNFLIGFLLVNAYAVQYIFSAFPIGFVVYLMIILFIIYDSKNYDKYIENTNDST